MKKHTDYVIDREGNAVAGAEVYVRKQSDDTLASLFSDDGSTAISNPVTTDSDGEFAFYVTDGTYKLQVYVGGVQQQEVNNFQHFDLDSITTFGFSLIDDADAATARTTLGLVIGTDVQAQDAELAAIAGLTSAADKGIQFTGSGTAATFDLTAAGKALLDDADAAAQRTTLGLGTIATQDADAVAITGGSVTGITDLALADGGTGASLADPGADRILFWDDSAGAMTWLSTGDGVTISGTSISSAFALAGAGQTATGIWEQAVDGTKATVDFTGLTGAGEIVIVCRNVTQSVSGSLALRVSTDNGSTFYSTSGDYVILGADSSEANSTAFAQITTPDATAARSGVARVSANGAGAVPYCSTLAGTLSRLFVASTSAVNAVRVYSTGGGNLSGGKIYCYKR